MRTAVGSVLLSLSAAGLVRGGAAMVPSRARTVMMTVDLTTYNVLSSHLAGADHFRACDPEHLKATNRYSTLMSRLREDIDKRSIICLQEVSQTWEGSLHRDFAKEGYYFITQLYGKPFNNYMGVGIAVPLDRYRIDDVNLARVSDTKRWPRPPDAVAASPLSNALGTFWSILRFPLDAIRGGRRGRRDDRDCWDKAKYRFNVQVSVNLADAKTGEQFSVSTYHMPCMFRDPDVMTIHCALSAQHAHRVAKGLPYVLAGDYNIKPTSEQYKMLVKDGDMAPDNAAYPRPPAHEPWRPALPEGPLRSAYLEANGEEPPFTNWAKIRDDPEFVETLDYIFLSPAWKVLGVGETPTRESCPGPYPNAQEPSDHVKISASLELSPKK
mmetsp:Transcript_42449/g.133096  ORF Transcript_42449/g.133096 Transcript_42449/m.133096 type:complete len:383 (-) Transcript_42449:128-1276(-)